MKHNRQFLLCLCIIATANSSDLRAQMAAMSASGPEAEKQTRKTVGFDQVKPILRKRCQNCHNPEELRGDFSVADMTAIQAGSSSGPVVVPGKPRESLLYTTTAHLDEPTMPPNSRKIPAREIEVIKRWIEDGLVAKSGDKPGKTGSEKSSAPAVPKPENESESGHFEPVTGVLQSTAFSAVAAQPKGNLVALSGNEQIVLLDMQSKSFVKALPFDEQEVTELAFSDDGKILVAGGGTPGLSGSVFGYDIESGKQLFKLADENDSILGLDISPDGKLVAFGGPSKVLKICQIEDGEVLFTLRKHTDWVLSTAFSDDGLLVASADRFGGLFVWETGTGELFHALKGHTGAVHDIAWDADGETLLSAGEDEIVRVWNLHHGELTAQWNGGVGSILSLERQGSYTVVGGRQGLAKVWNTPESCLGTYDAKEQIDSVVVNGDLTACIAADTLGNLHLLSLPNLQPSQVATLPTREQARMELVARLDRSSSEFELQTLELKKLEEERRKEAELLAQSNKSAASSVESQTPQQPADASAVTSNKPALVSAIESEIETVQQLVADQTNARKQLERQLENLKAHLESQERSIEDNKAQLARLKEILELARASTPKAK